VVKKTPPRLPGAALVFTDGQPLPDRGSRLRRWRGGGFGGGPGFLGFLGETERLPFVGVAAELRLDLFLHAKDGIMEIPFGSGGVVTRGVEGGLLLGFRVPLGGHGVGHGLHFVQREPGIGGGVAGDVFQRGERVGVVLQGGRFDAIGRIAHVFCFWLCVDCFEPGVVPDQSGCPHPGLPIPLGGWPKVG
jgi:hypothetical protein